MSLPLEPFHAALRQIEDSVLLVQRDPGEAEDRLDEVIGEEGGCGQDAHLHETQPACLHILSKSLILLRAGRPAQSRVFAEAAVDHSHNLLYSVPYNVVPVSWRSLYTAACILLAACDRVLAENCDGGPGKPLRGLVTRLVTSSKARRLEEAARSLDMALVIAGAPGFKDILMQCIEEVENALEVVQNGRSGSRAPSGYCPTSPHRDRSPSTRPVLDDAAHEPDAKRRKASEDQFQNEDVRLPASSADDIPVIRYPVRTHSTPPTILAFSEHTARSSRSPMVIRHAIDHWPALSRRRWSDIAYLKRVAGPSRTVPVEVGARYTDAGWTQRMMTFGEFVDRHVLGGSGVAYLAQHALFDQIPRLRNDIAVPEYCFVGNSKDVDVNAWFGPHGTVSPLHHDGDRQNLLAQVVGRKYVRLYAPDQTSDVYPFEDGALLSNTSQVDVESPDLIKYPGFAHAKYQECILEPGDMLYIPPRWWHYLRSLSVSFSVSFWF